MNKQMPVRSVWSTILILAAAARLAAGATYYVDGPGGDGLAEGGRDSNSGTLAAPWLTVSHGVEQLKPGDTLHIRGGEYGETLWKTIPSGTPEARVTVSNHEDEAVTLKPPADTQVNYIVGISGDSSYITLKGLILDGQKKIREQTVDISRSREGQVPHHIRVENCTIKGSRSSGLQTGSAHHCEFINLKITGNGRDKNDHGLKMGGSNNLVDGCEISHNYAFGMQIYGTGEGANGNVFRGNYVHDNGRHKNKKTAMFITKGRDNLVCNNVVVGQKTAVSLGGERTKFYNNTVVGEMRALGVSQTQNAQIKNNILVGGVRVEGGTNEKGEPNNVNPVLANNLTDRDPLFADAQAGNYRLKAGSPAIDAGVTVAEVATDKAGVARPQGQAPDIGAYEFRADQ
ncbi:MAG: right-handed parallel beta-helix repeat-containing protein [Kiritimatiellae bacterium]|nr:right-handed parallel beta-helix repeat-containing protein [Kiritimatiellia bacterium]